MVKLDAMENPYTLPTELRRELGRAARAASTQPLPDAEPAEAARRDRAAHEGARRPGGLLGNGSDELIQILITALARPGAR